MSLQCKQLSIEIAGKQVCNKLDLNITPGQVWGILGRNGIGKTTLLHTLAGLREATTGDILLDEQNTNQLTRKQIAQRVGVLLQHHEDSFPSTVLETVLTGRHPHIHNWQWENETDFALARHALQQVDMPDMENVGYPSVRAWRRAFSVCHTARTYRRGRSKRISMPSRSSPSR